MRCVGMSDSVPLFLHPLDQTVPLGGPNHLHRRPGSRSGALRCGQVNSPLPRRLSELLAGPNSRSKRARWAHHAGPHETSLGASPSTGLPVGRREGDVDAAAHGLSDGLNIIRIFVPYTDVV